MSDKYLSTYFPDAVTIVLSNDKFTHMVSGIAEGTFVSVARATPATNLVIGADRSAMRIRRRNRAGSITVTLMQSSDSNDVFSQILRNDEEAMNNDWLFSITVKDTSGRSLFSSPQAYIANMPDIAFGTDAENREWVIQCIDINSHVGGGGLIDPSTTDTMNNVGYTPDPQWIAS